MMARIRQFLGRDPQPEVTTFVREMRDARQEANEQTRASRSAQREIRERREHWYEEELLQRAQHTEDRDNA